MTTPAAWVEAWRASPSNERATVMSSLTFASVSTSSRSRGSGLERLLEGDVQLVGHELRDLVGFRIWHLEDATDIPNGRFGPECSEGNDLSHVVGAVFVDDVIEDLAAAVHTKVHVDIGKGYTFGIEKALEEQAVDERVEIRNPQRIGDETPGGACRGPVPPESRATERNG